MITLNEEQLQSQKEIFQGEILAVHEATGAGFSILRIV